LGGRVRVRAHLAAREGVLLFLLGVVRALVVVLGRGGHRDGHRARRLVRGRGRLRLRLRVRVRNRGWG